MAWRWWRRWRRWPARRWRRRRRRRFPARRRARRPARRYRRRPTTVRRRRRRWGRRRYRRGWRRRTYVKRGRHRRKKKRLILRQWQPATRRRCTITGYLPIVFCGHGRGNRNYALHSDDLTPQGLPYGGGLSTTSFSLKVLYDQHTRGLNKWSFPNDQLDLARYRGCKLIFYRTPKTDWIGQYDIAEPYKLDKYSCPNYHPGKLIQAKHKFIIPSYETNPKGRQKIIIKVPPPDLFVDKWYTQEDLCNVNLVSLAVSAASLLHPFSSPQTDNYCTTFQVLKEFYYKAIGFSATEEARKSVLKTLYTNNSYWESNMVPFYTYNVRSGKDTTKYIIDDSPTSSDTNNKKINFSPPQNTNYNWYTYNAKDNEEYLNNLRKAYFKNLTTNGPQTTTSNNGYSQHWTTPTTDAYEYHLGMFSTIFISPDRPIVRFPAAYQDVTYNPLLDKAMGNHIWFQYNTKADTQLVTGGSCKCHLENVPLWAAFYGYSDFVESELGPFVDSETVGLVCVICPYTQPPMRNKDNPMQGYVFYDRNFGNGKWTDGRGHIEPYWQVRWRPEMLFQESVMSDIVQTGPFSYKDDLKNSTLVMKYKFYFTWGGNMLFQQTIKNPCKDDGQRPSNSGRLPRELQVADPEHVGPRWVFHSFDWRRGFLSEKALKRLHEKPLDYESYFTKPKRPRMFPPTEGQLQQSPRQESDSSSEEERWQASTEEKAQEATVLLLKRRLREQRKLEQQLQFLTREIFKTQAGLHLNPMLFAQQ
nr:MAG: ORF1 [Torque teno virus]